MPYRDKSGLLMAKLRNIGRVQPLQPFHLCRVPARGCWPTVNPLILTAIFRDSRIFTPGQERHNRGTESTATRTHAPLDRVYGEGTSQWRSKCPGFSRATDTRPAIFGDCLRHFGVILSHYKTIFSFTLNEAKALNLLKI
jgi:hypothetical protein